MTHLHSSADRCDGNPVCPFLVSLRKISWWTMSWGTDWIWPMAFGLHRIHVRDVAAPEGVLPWACIYFRPLDVFGARAKCRVSTVFVCKLRAARSGARFRDDRLHTEWSISAEQSWTKALFNYQVTQWLTDSSGPCRVIVGLPSVSFYAT